MECISRARRRYASAWETNSDQVRDGADGLRRVGAPIVTASQSVGQLWEGKCSESEGTKAAQPLSGGVATLARLEWLPHSVTVSGWRCAPDRYARFYISIPGHIL